MGFKICVLLLHVALVAAKASILINPPAFPRLPTVKEASAASSAVGLNLDNVQGDILIGMRKSSETFYFFSVNAPDTFKQGFQSGVLPLITSTKQLLSVSTQPTTALNVAFSQTGLLALNITDDLGDAPFKTGQHADIPNIGDPSSANWQPEFAGTSIHGVFLFASDTQANIDAAIADVETVLGSSITKLYTIQGAARPGAEAGHEHFGYMDGISNPAVNGFVAAPFPGQAVVDAGTILLGQINDRVTRPAWALDGSFLVFRQLEQLVPEFNQFLADNSISGSGLTAEQGSDLLGARIIGRWKSGAPIQLSPLSDDPVMGANASRNNDFDYTELLGVLNSEGCPHSAHLRKTRPRSDLGTPEDAVHHIVRAGIPYGPEMAYQSSITNGFQFLQQLWINNPDFVVSGNGVDPLIGELGGAPRPVLGLDPFNPTAVKTLPTDFVVSRGGEYFFSPSLTALNSTIFQ
ncbi:unnamed protein product [Mycena citricolor]|uniref:DyP dimeric alpha+beta barrel domain-containing protein n=1 Tax=Mycena citricolor TaxID=2018698 RepID=A0AAD2HQ60_9AGAR|nr:unnamed protein product [Mycena citricolor]CAK5278984.1 unnamed protein product [Mycena citricolor]